MRGSKLPKLLSTWFVHAPLLYFRWVNPVINREYAMEEVQQVHYDIIHSKGAKGKLVLRVDKEDD